MIVGANDVREAALYQIGRVEVAALAAAANDVRRPDDDLHPVRAAVLGRLEGDGELGDSRPQPELLVDLLGGVVVATTLAFKEND